MECIMWYLEIMEPNLFLCLIYVFCLAELCWSRYWRHSCTPASSSPFVSRETGLPWSLPYGCWWPHDDVCWSQYQQSVLHCCSGCSMLLSHTRRNGKVVRHLHSVSDFQDENFLGLLIIFLYKYQKSLYMLWSVIWYTTICMGKFPPSRFRCGNVLDLLFWGTWFESQLTYWLSWSFYAVSL